MLNGEILPKFSKSKYLGHIITEDLGDNDDMSRQSKIYFTQCNTLIRKCYICTKSVILLYLNHLVDHYIDASCGVAIEQSLCNNVFRLLCNEPRDCNASYMFVSGSKPTFKMSIIKLYSFMTSIARWGNAILQNIISSDRMYISPLCRHWLNIIYVISYYS